MNRHSLLRLALAAAVFTAACGPQTGPRSIGQAPSAATQTSASAPVRGGTLTLAMARDATNLDPVRQSDTYSAAILNNVVDTLFEIDKDGEVVGRLVETSENPAPNVYRWTLRKGITFQDGTPLDSAAVKFNLERHMNDPKSTRRQDVKDITSIETPDPYTVVVTLRAPFGPFQSKLVGGAGYILSPTAVQKLGDSLQRDLTGAGSGPFKLVEWKKDTQITLQRNPDYWRKDAAGVQLPYLDSIVFKPYPDESVRTVALKTGEVDALVGNPSYRDAQDLKADSEFTVKEVPGLVAALIALNTEKPPFDNPAVRRAFSYAIDREQIRKTVYLDNGRALDTLVPQTVSWAYETDNHPYLKRDVAKAKQELAAAGFPNGLKFTFQTSNSSPESQLVAELIQAQVKDAGLQMDIQLLEFATVVKNGQAGDFQSLALGLSGDIDPDAFTYSLLYTNAGMNLAHYSNPKLDGLLDSGRATVDQAQRAAVYRQIQQIGLDEQPVITYWNAPQIAVARAGVQNFPATYNGYAGTRDLDKVWKTSKTS